MGKKTVQHRIIFAVILIIAFVLRFIRLSDVPPGVNRDEASIGVTAYSLLKTGKDEYGKSFPLSFQSFGDWKLPLYIYLTVPSVAVFGLNEFAVRLPSALAGTLTVLITYFLVLELFNNKLRITNNQSLALLSSFLLATSPWHMHLSRVESESNVAVLLTTAAILLLLRSFRGKPKLLPISSVLFALTYYTYHGNHIFTTLLLIAVFMIYRRKLLVNRYFTVSAVFFAILSGIILSVTLQSADRTKLAGIGIFSDPTIVHVGIEQKRTDHSIPQSLAARLLHNRLLFGIEAIARNYIRSFSPEFLFIRGGTNRAHNIENFGNLYLIEAPFLLLGVFSLFIARRKPWAALMLFWIAVAPFAASITKDAPHTNRMFAVYPIPAIVAALGLTSFTSLITRRRSLVIAGIVLLYLVNVTVYLDRYFIHFPRVEAQFWGYGYKKLAKILENDAYREMQTVISHPEYSPYIFLLFYQKTDPDQFRQSVRRYEPTVDNFIHVKSFGRFEFRDIDWSTDMDTPSLLVNVSAEVPAGIPKERIAANLLLPDGVPLFTLVAPR